MNLHYMTMEFRGREYETEIEYEYEAEEIETPTSPPFPERVLIYSVSLIETPSTANPQWNSVDVSQLLDRHQLSAIKKAILKHQQWLGLPRPVKQHRSFVRL